MAQIHFVPHTHWDREWYLPFQLFRLKLVHLMDSLLNILQDDEDFRHFNLDGQAVLLEDYLAIRPSAADLISEFVRSGRLQIGPWYVLPDEFLVSPEALVRNLTIGRQVCSRFGEAMAVGYVPDPFGHISQLPQILNGFGITRAAFRRGLSDEPVELYWEGYAGTGLLVSYLRDGYDNAARAPVDPGAFESFITASADSLRPYTQSAQILLLNGTDHQEPQPEIPELIASLSLEEDSIRLSCLEDYFDAVEKELEDKHIDPPTVSGEHRDPKRHHLLPGTLSSRIWIKQRNHTCEVMLERWAEPFTAWASLYRDDIDDQHLWTGHIQTPLIQNPMEVLHQTWKQLLKCHPHDSICGCSIDQVHEEMRTRFDMVEQISTELTRQSLSALTKQIDSTHYKTLGCRSALVVFNASPSIKTGRVFAKLELSAGLDPFEIVDRDGDVIAYRILEHKSRALADLELDKDGLAELLSMVHDGNIMGLTIQDAAVIEKDDHIMIDVTIAENAPANTDLIEAHLPQIETLLSEGVNDRFRLVARFAAEIEIEFLAHEVPAMGYRVYGLKSAQAEPEPDALDQTRTIQNEIITLSLDADGTLALRDQRSGAEYTRLGHFLDQADRGDSYTFCPLEDDPIDPLQVQIVNATRSHDALGSTLSYELNFELPEGLTTDRTARSTELISHRASIAARIYHDLARVDLDISIDNLARDHRLKVIFPAGIPAQQAEFDGHFEIIPRSTTMQSGDDSWAEQPVVEKPMRRFVAVHNEQKGLMIANRGLREASVNPEGEISITLLRSFGWLSRDDLSTRKGGAGPEIPTPSGQEIGEHTYQLAIIPMTEDYFEAVSIAEQFQTTMLAHKAALGVRNLPEQCSLVKVEHPAVEVTCVKSTETGDAMIVRAVNLANHSLKTIMKFGIPVEAVEIARIDESVLEDLQLEEKRSVDVRLEAGEIVTYKITPTR